MQEIKDYADQWNVSAQYFYEKGYYSWMAEKLSGYKVVLEIGCGTGYSTLALVEKGFKILAIDKNSDCIAYAKRLLVDKNVSVGQVTFLEGDIADKIFREEVSKYSFDVVACWNVGTYWSKRMMEHYVPYMLEYGFNSKQIAKNPESSYSELIIWNTCRLAKSNNVPVHIIDRGMEIINKSTNAYYVALKKEFKYKKIKYDNFSADSISNGGRMLSTNGIVNNEKTINIIFISIFME